MITETPTKRMCIILILLASLAMLAPGDLAAQTDLSWEFAAYPGEGGLPDFGRPIDAVASPDGRHLYVASLLPELITSFVRTDDGLESIDTLTSGDGGIVFSSISGIALTSDGRYVLVSSFISGNLLVFERDAESGLLMLIQDLTFDGLDQLDGVVADEAVVTWGVGPGGTYGLVLLEPAGTKQVGFNLTDFYALDDRGQGVALFDSGWAVWNNEALTLVVPHTYLCRFTRDDLAGIIDPDLQIVETGYFFFGNRASLSFYLTDGSNGFVANVKVNLDTCTPELEVLTNLADGSEEFGPAFTRLFGIGSRTFDVHTTAAAGFDEIYALRAHSQSFSIGDPNDPIEVDSSLTPWVFPEAPDAMGRPVDVAASDFFLDDLKAQGTSSAHVYTMTPSPAAVHAFRLTTRTSACVPSATRLCLNEGRFAVEATYTTTQGGPDQASAVPLTADTGYLTFFDPDNVEVMLKVLNGCGVNQSYWVFAAGLTDVQVEMTVTDTETGAVQTYANPLGQAFRPILDTSAFAGCVGKRRGQPFSEVAPAELEMTSSFLPTLQGCSSDTESLCLNNERFRITASWETADGSRGTAQALPITADTGTFWFFDDDNIEVVLKVLDACVINQRYWVFAGGLTDVRVELTVEDTVSGAVRTYTNPLGEGFVPIQDVEAFAACP